jgi:hypothetical protein
MLVVSHLAALDGAGGLEPLAALLDAHGRAELAGRARRNPTPPAS